MKELMTLIWASSFISCGLGLQTSSTGGQQCRSGAFANEFICDGANITEWQFDNFSTKTIEKITINKTFLSEFPAYAFNGLEIAVLLIEDNPLLKSIDPYAFKGLHFCETVIIRSNENLDIPLLFNLFDRLPGLKYLYLDDNFIQAKNADNDFLPTTAKSNMPDLQVLSLKGNPLQKISVDFFKPLATSSLKEINLQDCKLESIEIGAMQQVGNLKHVDLSTNYKLIQNQMHASSTLSWTTLKWTHLSLADNYIFELPYGLLEDMNETLQELDFSRNLLIEMNYFPMLTKLKTLYLDDCSIQTIAQDTFKHLIGLERLSIKRNRFVTLPGALMLPSLKSLFLSGDDDNEILDSIDVVNETFGPLTSLEHLQMTKFNFNRGLTKQMFQGLSNLTSLDLSYSSFSKINPGFLEHLPALQNLTMSNCKGFTAFPSQALRGPRNLQFVDLSSTLIFPIISGDHLSLNSSSLSHIRELNLSSSLINVNDALSNLDLAQMPELAKLDLSSNKIHNWSSKDKFGNNSKLEVLIMKSIHDYISLTKTMIVDFSKLKYLDLTENLFICNEEVADFFLLAEKSKTLFVEGWYHGFGFRCIQDPELGNITTFYEYASNGLNMSDPIPQQNIEDSYSKMALILVVIGVSSIVIITILINVVHQNWWMIQYKYARWRWLRNNDGHDKSIIYDFDAFVSYSSTDQEWIEESLVANMEPGYKLCLHQRDFSIGKSITENIVESMSKSKGCLIILSDDYLKSNWCNFEAQVAQSIMGDKITMIILDPQVLNTTCKLTTIIKTLIKTRTYITWDAKDTKFWRRIGNAMARTESMIDTVTYTL